jgi:hypothetical protein
VAHRAYLSDCSALQEAGNSQAGTALSLATGLQRNVKRLNQAIASVYAAGMLDPKWGSNAFVFVGKARKKFFTKTVGHNDAICVDLDLILRLVLLIFLVGFDREKDVTAETLAAFLLLSLVVPRDEEFPHIDGLLNCFAALNGRLLNDRFSIAGNFTLYHELSHTYVNGHSADFLRVAFEIPA